MAIDSKYGRVTLEHGDVGEEEPVVVFRARDSLLPKILAYYHYLCIGAESPMRHLNLILKTRDTVMGWQRRHWAATRVPTSDNSRMWMD